MDWTTAKMCSVISDKIYMNHDDCQDNLKEYISNKKGFQFLNIDGAQGCMFRHNKDTVVIGFRGTEPTKLNDVLADLKAWRETSDTIGLVHT